MSGRIDLSTVSGLSESEARKRLLEDGLNELPSSKARSGWRIAFEVVKEPMFLLLAACGLLYLTLGDKEEALMLLGFVLVIVGITFYQERKTERALEALRDLSSPRAMVIRDGQQKRIPGREVARGDILVLGEGDRVPADVILFDGANLSVDESLLTGEPVPVRKVSFSGTKPTAMGKPGGDDLPFLFSGTLVVSGQGIAEVLASGMHTELGKIGKALQNLEPAETRLKVEIGRIVKIAALIGACCCTLVVVVYGLTRGNWTEGFLAGITLAMATLPEEFPVVLTIFLALGAWRITGKNVLTRQVPAVEELGATTVLCSDKTGTLTQNRMTVVRLAAGDDFCDLPLARSSGLPEAFHQLMEYSVLASQLDPFDPMDKAIKKVGVDYLAGTEHIHTNWSLVKEYSLSPALLAISHVWTSPDGNDFVIASKGSPEAIMDLCHLSREKRDLVGAQVINFADQGLRVLGVARASFHPRPLPSNQHDFHFEFSGLLGFVDPVRETVPGAVAECRTAGIKVVMITGDYPGTARNIAHQIGIDGTGGVITGPELDSMDDPTLAARVKNANVFARIVPEQKMRIVQAFKAGGEIVAMTGDGVNDAPALRAAHIGIAMGARGTDVAREASSLVLLDDDFTSIVAAVRLGRRIYDNIQKALGFIVAIHVPIAGLSLLPVILEWRQLLLLPVHVVFLELLIDPACSIVFEAESEESDIMNRPPRLSEQPIFGARHLILSLMQGFSILVTVLAVYFISSTMFPEKSIEESRTLMFTTLIVANLCLILVNRSWTRSAIECLKMPNAAQWWVTGGGVVFLLLTIFVPFLRSMFKFEVLHLNDFAVCLLAGVFSLLWFEGFKYVHGHRAPSRDALNGGS